MREYNHSEIEAKWQNVWQEKNVGQVAQDDSKKKFYCLMEFPYPSGDGLHAGHVRGYTAMDIIARKRRAEGYNVLYPIGWDAFGLPTENYAIKTGIHPAIVTRQNTDKFRAQFLRLGYSFDWSREVNTSDPAYYKWTQWIFLQLFKKGLAYKAKSTINWCPKDKIGLANEEVVGGNCERCGTAVEKREKEQWMLAITKYADRLDKDLDTVNFLDKIKTQQREWIGRSEGAEIDFELEAGDQKLGAVKIFTTRPDTLFGATYLVLAPEHPLLASLQGNIANNEEVSEYVVHAKQKTEIERSADNKEKTGVQLNGIFAINPVNKEKIPVFIADYVLPHYGTGAIMAVPAHDERDFAFAKKFNLRKLCVIDPVDILTGEIYRLAGKTPEEDSQEILREIYNGERFYTGGGKLINSGNFDGLFVAEAKEKITHAVGGKLVTTYKLRDWVFSRQRYWGEPIPLVLCQKDGWVALPETQLPLVLPDIEDFKPTDNGESPLAKATDWINTTCPTCGGPATRETDVMPNWAGSSWYYLRYTDAQNESEFASKKKMDYWTPVDWYNGGMEHTTLHLLYSRFWHKFLFDQGLVPTSEPYMKRTSHGLILAEGGVKMSKSKGNVINPDDIVGRFGADTLRLYEMFLGPFDQPVAWSEDGLLGPRRFIERVWKMQEKVVDGETIRPLVHKTVKKVSDDIETLSLNTAVSALMILANDFEKTAPNKAEYYTLLRLVAPFAPHVTEELWSEFGGGVSIHAESWPSFDHTAIENDVVTVSVQIDGRVRGTVQVKSSEDQEVVLSLAKEDPEIQKWLTNIQPTIVKYIPGRTIVLVTKKK